MKMGPSLISCTIPKDVRTTDSRQDPDKLRLRDKVSLHEDHLRILYTGNLNVVCADLHKKKDLPLVVVKMVRAFVPPFQSESIGYCDRCDRKHDWAYDEHFDCIPPPHVLQFGDYRISRAYR